MTACKTFVPLRFSRLLIGALAACSLSVNDAAAQVKTERQLREKLAAAAFEFASDRELLPDRFAVFAIGTMATIRDGNPIEVPVAYLHVEDKSKDLVAAIFGYRLPAHRSLWEVYCNRGDEHKVVFGFPNQWFNAGLISPATTIKVSNAVRNSRKGLLADPYLFAFGPLNDGMYQGIDDMYGITFLMNADFRGSEQRQRSLLGAWHVNYREPVIVDMIFEHKRPNRPAQVIWRRCKSDTEFEERKEHRIFTVIDTKWSDVEIPSIKRDKKSLAVPTSIQNSMYLPDGTVSKSMQLEFCWIAPGEDEEFVDVEWDKIDEAPLAHDRRAPFFELIPEWNWELLDLSKDEIEDLVTPRFRGKGLRPTSPQGS